MVRLVSALVTFDSAPNDGQTMVENPVRLLEIQGFRSDVFLVVIRVLHPTP